MSLSKDGLRFGLSELYTMLNNYAVEMAVGVMVAGVAAYVLTKSRGRGKVPPGPWGLPILGYAPFLTERFPTDFRRLGVIYGDVFSFYYGQRLLVVLNSHTAVKDAFVNQADDFAHRPPEFDKAMKFHDEIFTPPYHEACKTAKRLSSTWLKKVGLGAGPQCDARVSPEIRQLMTYIRLQGDVPLDAAKLVYKLTGRVLCLLLFGELLAFDDPELQHFIDVSANWNKIVFGDGAVYSQKPTAMGDFLWARKWAGKVDESAAAVRQYVRQKVLKRKENFDADNLECFLDHFINERGLDYDLETMVGTTLILTPDTTDTLCVSIQWLLLYLTTHPTILSAVQSEIDDVIGSAQPSLKHRPQMPYTEAVLLEVLRLNSVFEVSFAHSTPWDRAIKFRDYVLPPKTIVYANLGGINKDPEVFSEPDQFKPERFLNEAGKVINANRVMNFSTGKRVCMGEQQAKSVQFLFITNILQSFSLSFPVDQPSPTLEHQYAGMAIGPCPYKLMLSPRQQIFPDK